mmetsp:Transcript_15747/g.46710  ORF Transcript_15747/g.46710 Transcript_15747/m.46710 type:complete len:246 (+) Transcript_15747:206-943(+)
MLLPFAPLPLELPAVCPKEEAHAILQVVFVLTLVHATIGPRKFAFPIHAVGTPISLVLPAVGPNIDAEPAEVIIVEAAGERRTILPIEAAASVFRTCLVYAFVSRAVRPTFPSRAVLLITCPLPLVHRAVRVGVLAMAMCHVIKPLAIINVAIAMDELAFAMRLVLVPLAGINSPVSPPLLAVAVPLLSPPLACVNGAIRQRLRRPLLVLRQGLDFPATRIRTADPSQHFRANKGEALGNRQTKN